MSTSIKIKIDGKETTLHWRDYITGMGHKYLDEQLKHKTYLERYHYFNVRLSELPKGFSFKKSSKVFEIIG